MNGDPVNFEFSSDDARAAAPITIRDEGASTPRILSPSERFILVSYVGALAFDADHGTIFSDNNNSGSIDANESMAVLSSGDAIGIRLQQAANRGVTPKVQMVAAGTVRIAGRGVIVKG